MATADDSLALLEAGLTAQERQFVHTLVSSEDWNLAAAARAAGYEGSSPSDFAVRLMRGEKVRRCLALIQADRRERHKDVRDSAIQMLWMLATHDIKDLAKAGELLPPDELPAGIRCAIKGVKFTKNGWEYTLIDRTVVLSMLLKHFELGDQAEGKKAETQEGVTIEMVTPQ